MIDNQLISAINLKLHDSGSGESEYREFKMIIDSFEGKYEFMVAEDAFYKPAQRSLRRQGPHAF